MDGGEEWNRKRIAYLSGPMAGLPGFNFEAFDAAAALLELQGFRVFNPAQIDRENGFDPSTDLIEDFDLKAAAKRDVDAIFESDVVILLPGYENSKGVTAERMVAKWIGVPEYEYPTMLPASHPINASVLGLPQAASSDPEYQDDEDVLDIAARLTRGNRQAQYGPPDQDFRRTADMATALFGDKLKTGYRIETHDVAQFMILLKLSRLQHRPKKDSIADLAGYARCMDICYQASDSYRSDSLPVIPPEKLL